MREAGLVGVTEVVGLVDVDVGHDHDGVDDYHDDGDDDLHDMLILLMKTSTSVVCLFAWSSQVCKVHLNCSDIWMIISLMMMVTMTRMVMVMKTMTMMVMVKMMMMMVEKGE